MTTIELLQKTKAAWPALSAAPAEEKNRLLLAMADALEESTPAILAANAQDMADAEGHISAVMLDRLRLDKGRIRVMADGVRAAAALPDHTGRTLAQFTRPNGMTITKVQVPLGLVAIIYESRPNVTSDAAALAVKSGNVCMLRSGKEAYRSCRAIVAALKTETAVNLGLPDPVYPRIDHVVIQYDANKNVTEIVVKNGTAASNPQPPERSTSEALYEIHLAEVRREPGATAVTARNVTDLRLNENYCGIMAESVTKVDTAVINAQVTAPVSYTHLTLPTT